MTEFVAFPKIARLNRDIVVTEKIDGTNAAVVVGEDAINPVVFAQSRSRMLTPGKATDNFGFAAWVEQHREALALLGPGHHYGEWYGQGIQRTYGLKERRFALFSVMRWVVDETQAAVFKDVQSRVPGLETVPLMYRGSRLYSNFGENPDVATDYIHRLQLDGSRAVPGFMQPEGIVVLHLASKQLYKVTCEGDEQYKGANAQSPS